MAGKRKPLKTQRRKCGPKPPGEEINYKYIDRLIVHGETRVDPTTKEKMVTYPTYRELAARFGVSHTTISNYARRHNCIERRKKAIQREHEKIDQTLAELRSDARALSIEDELRMVDSALLDAWTRIKEGGLRVDSISDLNVAIRLKKFLMGDVESRVAVQHGIAIEDIQKRHQAAVKLANTVADEAEQERARLLAGEVDDAPIDVEFTAEDKKPEESSPAEEPAGPQESHEDAPEEPNEDDPLATIMRLENESTEQESGPRPPLVAGA